MPWEGYAGMNQAPAPIAGPASELGSVAPCVVFEDSVNASPAGA